MHEIARGNIFMLLSDRFPVKMFSLLSSLVSAEVGQGGARHLESPLWSGWGGMSGALLRSYTAVLPFRNDELIFLSFTKLYKD